MDQSGPGTSLRAVLLQTCGGWNDSAGVDSSGIRSGWFVEQAAGSEVQVNTGSAGNKRLHRSIQIELGRQLWCLHHCGR